MSSVLIVESKNDKLFVEALVEHLNLTSVALDESICRIDEYECLEGLNPNKLRAALNAVRNSLVKDDIQALGIILDHDGRQVERVTQINDAVQAVFDTTASFSETINQISVMIDLDSDTIELQAAYFLTNVDGTGELETLLKAIKSKPSPYADCLENWRRCLTTQGQPVHDKEFDKFWVNNYVRFDTCSKKERKQADRKCSMQSFEYVMTNKQDIWDFEHPALVEFKDFLRLFEAGENS